MHRLRHTLGWLFGSDAQQTTIAHLILSVMQALACWRTVWWLFLTAVPFKLLNDGAQFVGPFFLNKLLDVIQDGDSQVLRASRQSPVLVDCRLATQAEKQAAAA